MLSQRLPPPITFKAPRAISRLKRHALQLDTQGTPSSVGLLTDQFGKAAEDAAADKDLSTGMLKDLRCKAKFLKLG